MKQQLQAMINNLKNFLDNMSAINEHPYSLGLDTKKLLTDLQDFAKDLEKVINELPEEAPLVSLPEEMEEDKKEQEK